MPDWLDNLITKESHEIVKKAQDDKVKELEKKIQNAKTPEELDAIEKELQELEKSAGNTDETADKDETSKPADKDEASKPADKDEASKPPAQGEEAGAKNNKIIDKHDEIEGKLLNEIEKLNDQLGLNKIIDLNTTMNTANTKSILKGVRKFYS
jgi:vacuolar-type H+-ATPase subunit I/STV1